MLSTRTILATPLPDYGARYQVILGVSDTHGVWRTSRVSLTPIDILPQVGPLVPRGVIYLCSRENPNAILGWELLLSVYREHNLVAARIHKGLSATSNLQQSALNSLISHTFTHCVH